ncbi:MAG: glutamate--tRNA ligase [Thermoplasmatota archaeon]
MSEDLATIARRFCLQNAVQHGGTCNPKSLMGRVMGGHPEFRADPGAVAKALAVAGAEVNAMDLEAQQAELAADAPDLLETKKKERRTGLKPLPGVEEGSGAKVVLRFAPNPNGPLTFGHSRGVAVHAEYARLYDAELVLRFDDTDPQVKPPLYDPAAGVDAYQMIRDDFAWLAGREATREVLASDRIAVYHDHARTLIEAGGAYVCTCDAEAWRDMKNQGHPCPHRDLAPADLLAAFEKMVAGKYAQGAAVLRVKTDIEHKDPALRDWTAFRIVAADAVHPREASGEIPRHVCWPLLDFESAVEDHLQGVTHVIRGKDLMDSTRKQAFLYQHMGWDYPETLYWGRVSVHEFGKFSTSGMRKAIEAGDYEGWDDPRLPTLAALRRRGYRADALRQYWIDLGLTEKDIAASLENLDAENGKRIDADAPRYFFVPDPRPVSLSGAEGLVAKPLLHPPDEARGVRELPAATTVHLPAKEAGAPRVRLKDLGNVVLAGGSGFFAGEEMDRGVPIIQWLPAGHAEPFTVLRSVPVPEDADDDALPTLERVEGVVEPAVLAKVGETVQFERFGFVRIESATHGVYLHG